MRPVYRVGCFNRHRVGGTRPGEPLDIPILVEAPRRGTAVATATRVLRFCGGGFLVELTTLSGGRMHALIRQSGYIS